MNQSTNTLILEQSSKLMTSMQNILRGLRNLSSHLTPQPIGELLVQLEEAATPAQLTRIVNKIQNTLWKMPTQEQATLRTLLIAALTTHVLQDTEEAMRLEAAGWLRLLVQAGLVPEPREIFVTLVTATTQAQQENEAGPSSEQRAYLKMIFDCFWSFRYPYPAFNWQQFPANEVFYPLAFLLASDDYATQDIAIGIFSELATLDDTEIQRYLLPVALQWSKHADAERRRRVTHVLARMSCTNAQEALDRLLVDPDPLVCESAKSASGYVRKIQ